MPTPTSEQTCFHASFTRRRAERRQSHAQNQTTTDTVVASQTETVLESSFIFCLQLHQTVRWWREPSTPTHQPSDPLSSKATALAQRLPWLAKHTHTYDISSLASESQTATHTHADTYTQTYTLWHFPVKRTSVHSPSHHHHHNQRSFVERQRGGQGHWREWGRVEGETRTSKTERGMAKFPKLLENRRARKEKKKKGKSKRENHKGKKNAVKRERQWHKETTDR